MTIDFNSLKAQLIPSWSGVNIVITILAFLMFWPLGLLMVGYIVKGADFGLNLAQPSSFLPFFRDIGDLIRETTRKFTSNQKNRSSQRSTGGRPLHDAESVDQTATERDAFESWRKRETESINRERQALEKDKADFEAQKRKYEESS